MDRPLVFVLILHVLSLATTSHAAISGEVYWRTVLPNTTMPSAIRDLLKPDSAADQKAGATVKVGNGGVNVNSGKGTRVNVGHKGVGVNVGSTGKGSGGTTVNVGHGGVSVTTGHKGKPVVVSYSPFHYRYGATDTQIHDDPRSALFFLEKDLRPGAKTRLRFSETPFAATTFLSRREASSIPFSSAKLPEILARLAIRPDSPKAKAMKQTLGECEEPRVEGERKYCATSLESMVEFAWASLGTRDLLAVSTAGAAKEQEYTVGSAGMRRLAAKQLAACHEVAYAYAVFYCHAAKKSMAYEVEMVGRDGTVVEAVAVCHTDTAAWNPRHVAFKVLKVMPGTVPVCHFLPQDHLVWARKDSGY